MIKKHIFKKELCIKMAGRKWVEINQNVAGCSGNYTFSMSGHVTKRGSELCKHCMLEQC